MNSNDLVKETPMPCPEEDCSGTLQRRFSPKFHRYFYGCSNWSATRCNGSIGCHPDGSMLGIPADSKTKQSRIVAHGAFDRVWKSKHVTRREAYAIFSEKMEVEELHIANLDTAGCKRLELLVLEYMQQELGSGRLK